MESRHVSQNKGQEETTEKTNFEKLQDEVKEVIFGVLSVLLKDDEASFWGFVIGTIVDSFQMYQFVFDARYPWGIESVSKYVSIIANSLELGTWIAYTKSWIVYLVLFYICIFLVILVILDVIYVAYSFTKKKFAFIWPVHALRSICSLIVTVLFMPILEYFTTMFICTTDDMNNSVHSLFNDEYCWQGLHILHVSFGAIIGMIFILICLIVTYTFFQPKSKTNDPSARSDSKCEIFIIAFKTVLTLLYSFFADSKYRWLLVILLCAGSTYLFYTISHERPYYNEKISKFLNCVHGAYMFSSYVTLIIMILESIEFTAGLQLFIIGFPIFVIVIVVYGDTRNRVLLKPLEEFKSGREFQIKVKYFITLITQKDNNKYFNRILRGYIYDHEDSCTIIDCPLKAYKNSLIGMLNDKKKKQSKSGTLDNPLLLLNFANRLYLSGLSKFPNCTSLRISYAFFLLEHMGNKNRAIIELGVAEKSHPPFDEEFIIYRFSKMIEDEMQESHADGNGNLDIVNGIAYDNHVRQCKSYIDKAAYFHHEFWTLLLEDKPDFIKLDKSGSKINAAVASVEDHWAKLQKISPNEPKSLRIYAEFLIEILNDKESGAEMLSRAKDTAMSKNNIIDSNMDQNLLQSDGAACIVASGEVNKLGEILKFNQSTCRIFGYTSIDLQGRKVSMIMPDMLSKYHEQVMQNAANNNDDLKESTEKIVLGKHKNGYLIPLHKFVRASPSIQGFQFFATFKSEKRSSVSTKIAYVIIDTNKEIKYVSSTANSILGINNRLLQKARCFLNTLAPTMFESTYLQQCTDKNGGEIEYFYPDLGISDVNDSFDSKIIEKGILSDQKFKSPHKINDDFKPKIGASKTNKAKFKCHIGSLSYTEVGQAGNFVRFETLPNENIGKCKKYEKVPEFQFLYSVDEKKFYRVMHKQKDPELKQETKNEESSFEESHDVSFSSDDGKNNEEKKKEDNDAQSNKQNYSLSPEDDEYEEYDDSEEYEYEEEGEEDEEKEEGAESVSKEENKTKIDSPKGTNTSKTKEEDENHRSNIENMLKEIDISEINFDDDQNVINKIYKEQKDFSNDIATKRLGLDGLLLEVNENQNEQEAKKVDEEKKEEEMKEDANDDKNMEIFRNNIKTKKALNSIIKEKSEPPAINKLKKTAYILIIVLLALISSEYGVILSQFSDISENLKLVEYGFQRQTLQMRITYDIGKLVYYCKKYKNVTTSKGFSIANPIVNISRKRMEVELNSYYNIQNLISLSKIDLSDDHKHLYSDKVVTLYFNERSSNVTSKKKMYFTLTESILQMTSSIFTVLNLALTTVNFDVDQQDDVSFILYNTFSNINEILGYSSDLYVEELIDRSISKNKLILIFFILSIIIVLSSIAICFPVINSVGKTRMNVLQLFLNIPLSTIKVLIQKCEKYTSKTPDDGNEEGDSLNNESFNLESTATANQNTAGTKKKLKKRDFSHNNISNVPFFLKYILGCVLMEAYFTINYFLAIDFLKKVECYGKELNATSLLEAHNTYVLSILEYAIKQESDSI